MEDAAAGMPVVSTYHSGIPELVSDKKSGFLVLEKDTDAMVEKLEFLIEHPEICLEMGKEGRRYVEENYNIKVLNKKLIKIFDNLIE